jgi:predicted nucleic acid-binding protein
VSVLVDTSVWVEYFRTGKNSEKLDFFIDENIIVTNDLILSELVPSLKIRNQQKIIKLLNNITRLDLLIDWSQITDLQYTCLKNGLNGIGIPDLIIAQNAIQNNCAVYTFDGHFRLMKDILKFQVID